METVTIPKQKYVEMQLEIRTLKNTKLYQRLWEFQNNIRKGEKYSRKDLGF